MKKFLVMLFFGLLLYACGRYEGSTFYCALTPASVTVCSTRGLMPDESRNVIYQMAEKHCQKASRHAVLHKEWHGGTQSQYNFECKN